MHPYSKQQKCVPIPTNRNVLNYLNRSASLFQQICTYSKQKDSYSNTIASLSKHNFLLIQTQMLPYPNTNASIYKHNGTPIPTLMRPYSTTNALQQIGAYPNTLASLSKHNCVLIPT